MSTMTNPSFTQATFRGYGDGTQTGSTALANQDTNWTIDVGTTFQVRIRVQQTDAGANQNLAVAFKLKYQKNGTGGYTDVGAQASATDARMVNSASITDGENIATGDFRLGAGSGTAIAGECEENNSSDTITFSTSAQSYTELLFIVELHPTQVSDGDTFDFRVYTSADVALNAYTVTPQATANVPDTVDDLLAEDVASASSVGTPAIGQTHVLNAADVASASSVGAPVLRQVHALLVAGAGTPLGLLLSLTRPVSSPTSASSVSEPALAIVTPLLAEDVASASSVGTPAIGQIHALLAADVTSASSVGTPALGQVHALLANDVASASSVSTPVLAQEGEDNLLAEDVASASSVTAPALGQIHALFAADVASASSVSTPAITEEGGEAEPEVDRSPDAGPDRASYIRRKRRINAERLQEILEARQQAAEEPAPPPTPERIEAVGEEIVATIEAQGLLGPARPAVAQFVAQEVEQFYVPRMDWGALAAAARQIMARAAEEAARIEREIEDEDEMVLLMVA